jgi:hypothetical protein
VKRLVCVLSPPHEGKLSLFVCIFKQSSDRFLLDIQRHQAPELLVPLGMLVGADRHHLERKRGTDLTFRGRFRCAERRESHEDYCSVLKGARMLCRSGRGGRPAPATRKPDMYSFEQPLPVFSI